MKKIIVLTLAVSIVFLLVGYLCCYANTLELDYTVTDLKTKISNLEYDNSKLKEAVSKTKDPDMVKEWAENNSFVEVTKVEYFNLNTEKTIAKK